MTSSSGAKSLTTVAFQRLRMDIINGALVPDERLRIQSLSERYAIGVTAIREALSRLVTDGLVDLEDQRGFCVAPVSRAELIDLTQVRIDVEGLAITMAIERGGLEWESNLLSSFHRLSKTPAPTSPELYLNWAEVHRHFHEALLSGCGSPWTLRLCRLLYDKSERYRNLSLRRSAPHDLERDTHLEHQKLLGAAMARDATLAKQLVANHFGATSEAILHSAFGGRHTLAAVPVGRVTGAGSTPD